MAVLHKALAGVDHEDALAGVRLSFVQQHDAGRNTGAVKQVGGQANDALDVALANQVASDVGFGIAPEEHPVGQDARALAGAFEGSHDVQQVGVVALLGGGNAETIETPVRIVVGGQSRAPPLVRERRIGHHEVENLEAAAVRELGIGQGIALGDERGGVVMQNHVHPGQAGGRGILFLTVKGDSSAGLVGHLQQQRAGAAGGVVHRGVGAGLGRSNAQDLGHDPADLGRGVELPLRLAAFGGEMPHQVFVGVPQDIVTLGPVLRKIQRPVLEDGDQVRQPFHHLLAAAQLAGIIEVRHVRQPIGVGQRCDDALIDLVADIRLALERHHVLEG